MLTTLVPVKNRVYTLVCHFHFKARFIIIVMLLRKTLIPVLVENTGVATIL